MSRQVFDLSKTGDRFTIGESHVVVVPAPGDVTRAYRNAVTGGLTLDPETGRPTKVKGVASAEFTLIKGCTFYDTTPDVEGDDGFTIGEMVPSDVLQSWPGYVQSALVEAAKVQSRLSQDSAIRKAILKAFKRKDSPISLEDLSEWLEKAQQEDSSIRPLYVTVGTKDEVKNS